MGSIATAKVKRPVVYVDANPMYDRHLTGIGRYTARVALALAGCGADVRFFSMEREVHPPADLDWSPDQDLKEWGHRVWKGKIDLLRDIPDGAMSLWTCTRPTERNFSFEVSVLYDFTPLVVPWTHSEETKRNFQYFFGKGLMSSDAAIAISHNTKADAGWLCDMPQERVVVSHPGPTICVEKHLHEAPVTRRPNVGLVVSTLEPRKNAYFLLEWFRSTDTLPEGTELWWVGPMGWLMSRKELKAYEKLKGRRIRFLGVVSDRKLCELYQRVGWSVYPSLYEGFGFPVLDSLRHGTPVIASANSSIREFQSPGLYLFDPHDPSSLDRAFRAHLAASPVAIPREPLEEEFNWKRVGETILDLPRAISRLAEQGRQKLVYPESYRAA